MRPHRPPTNVALMPENLDVPASPLRAQVIVRVDVLGAEQYRLAARGGLLGKGNCKKEEYEIEAKQRKNWSDDHSAAKYGLAAIESANGISSVGSISKQREWKPNSPLFPCASENINKKSKKVATPEGVEPPISWFVAKRLIQLGYGVVLATG